jgi:predicted ArsR family transcriptional regulator
MKRKEAIIRYLGQVGRGNRHQIAEAIKASPQIVTARLTELKGAGVAKNLEWPDGSKVWVLTEEGARRFDYYVQRDRGKREA